MLSPQTADAPASDALACTRKPTRHLSGVAHKATARSLVSPDGPATLCQVLGSRAHGEGVNVFAVTLQTFQLLIDDDRYTVATLNFVAARDAKRARAIAEKILRDTAHHRGVEVFQGDLRLFGLGTMAEPEGRSQ